jgi:hypothetical protein
MARDKNRKIQSSCLFVHQCVAATDAKEKNQSNVQNFITSLDEATQRAAEYCGQNDVKQFKEVIDFDIDDVMYFAAKSIGKAEYSRDVMRGKQRLFNLLKKCKTRPLNCQELANHLGDLWAGILSEDFVFGFKNSVQIREYGRLEQEFMEIEHLFKRKIREKLDLSLIQIS